MFRVISNETIGENLHKMVVSAPRVASARKPGQFVIVRLAQGEERIPLTISDADPVAGTITLFIQAVGASTRKIVATKAGELIRDVAGPLGNGSRIINWGRVVCVGGGVGTAVLFPLVKALAEAGNRITTIIGGRSGPLIILACHHRGWEPRDKGFRDGPSARSAGRSQASSTGCFCRRAGPHDEGGGRDDRETGD